MEVRNTNLSSESNSPLFNKKMQKKINWFVFFLAFPAIDILGQSITFYLFLALLIDVGIFWKQTYPGKALFFTFLVFGTISALFSPISEVFQNLSFVKTIVQFFYWIALASFFIIFFNRIDLKVLSKWIFFGIITYTFAFYILQINFNSAIFSINCTPGRNAYVFVILCCTPLSFIYLKEKSKLFQLLAALFILFSMLASNGRAGAIIIIIELLFIFIIIFPRFGALTKAFIVISIGVYVLSQFSSFNQYKIQIANQIEIVSPRFASLIKGEGEGNLKQDKSWLIRKLMIDKGTEIFYKYPFFGVGPLNFKKYRADLKTFAKYNRLHRISRKKFELDTSPHNTYLQVITEFGLLGSLIFLLILFKPLIKLLKPVAFARLNANHLFLIALLGMSIHFYSIATLSGALPWFIIGLAWASAYNNRPVAA